MRSISIIAAVAAVSLIVDASPVRADATVFVGALTSGGLRSTLGVSVGIFPPALGGLGGFELEYARTGNDSTPTRIDTFGGNLFLQSSVFARRLQAYGSFGAGIYGETAANGLGSGEVASGNVGGGLKIHVIGPLRVRLDYRVFFLGRGRDASAGFLLHRHPQRISAGFGIAF